MSYNTDTHSSECYERGIQSMYPQDPSARRIVTSGIPIPIRAIPAKVHKNSNVIIDLYGANFTPNMFVYVLDDPITVAIGERLHVKVIFNHIIEKGPIAEDPFWGLPARWDVGNAEHTTVAYGCYTISSTGVVTAPWRCIQMMEPGCSGGLYLYVKYVVGDNGLIFSKLWGKPAYEHNSFKLEYPKYRYPNVITQPIASIWISSYHYPDGGHNSHPLRLTFDEPRSVPENSLLEIGINVYWDRVLPPFPTE